MMLYSYIASLYIFTNWVPRVGSLEACGFKVIEGRGCLATFRDLESCGEDLENVILKYREN